MSRMAESMFGCLDDAWKAKTASILAENLPTDLLFSLAQGISSGFQLDVCDTKKSLDHLLIHLVWRETPRNDRDSRVLQKESRSSPSLPPKAESSLPTVTRVRQRGKKKRSSSIQDDGLNGDLSVHSLDKSGEIVESSALPVSEPPRAEPPSSRTRARVEAAKKTACNSSGPSTSVRTQQRKPNQYSDGFRRPQYKENSPGAGEWHPGAGEWQTGSWKPPWSNHSWNPHAPAQPQWRTPDMIKPWYGNAYSNYNAGGRGEKNGYDG